MNVNDKQIINQFQILLFSKWFEKIQLVFMNYKLNEEKIKIDKWDMNLDNLMNYKYAHNSWIQSILTTVKTDQQQHKEITLIECELQNNQLFYHSNFIILNFKLLRFKILEFAHNIMIAEHSNCVKIYEIVQQIYYWFMMYNFIRRYVQSCSTCT